MSAPQDPSSSKILPFSAHLPWRLWSKSKWDKPSNLREPWSEHLLIVTDAWLPMLNGVVTRIREMKERLEAQGIRVSLLTPRDFPHIQSDVIYPGLKLTLPFQLDAIIDKLNPDRMLIMTEYTLGLAARMVAVQRGIPYASSYTTNFQDATVNYKWLLGTPKEYTDLLINSYIKWFHAPSHRILVNTESNRQELIEAGYDPTKLKILGGAVDTHFFRPNRRDESVYGDLPRPIFLYVGRVSHEKRVDEFLKLSLPGSKVIIGDGPAFEDLKRQFVDPNIRFLGRQRGSQLAAYYASADVFVFPSEFETLGRVMLEALASGLPIAAKPVRGPIDILHNNTSYGPVGIMDTSLQKAAEAAWALVNPAHHEATTLANNRQQRHSYCQSFFSWDEYLPRLLSYIPQIPKEKPTIQAG